MESTETTNSHQSQYMHGAPQNETGGVPSLSSTGAASSQPSTNAVHLHSRRQGAFQDAVNARIGDAKTFLRGTAEKVRLLPGTDERLEANTRQDDLDEIQGRTLATIARYRGEPPEDITRRIRSLEIEWDVERTLELLSSSLVLLTLLVGGSWRLLTFVVASFLLNHALYGWCPPLPVLRRLGIRTSKEIHEEMVALKVLRGDFDTQLAQRSTGPADPVELWRESKLQSKLMSPFAHADLPSVAAKEE